MELTRAMPLVGAPMLEWALWYAEVLGWAVFPCKGKKPLTKNGFKDASTGQAQIAAWWAKWPSANIAAPTGVTFCVLDQDNRHGGDATRRELEASYAPLGNTVTCLTGSRDGSTHTYWTGELPNKAPLGSGLDVQGKGSYVILPPSIHPDSGQRYEWECTGSPDDPDVEMQPAPDWLIALAQSQPERDAREPVPFDPDAIIPNGQRNTTIWHTLRTLHRNGASVDALHTQAAVENARCEEPLKADELEAIVVSAQNGDVFTQMHVGTGGAVRLNTAAPGFSNVHAPAANDPWRVPPEQQGWYKAQIDPYTSKRGIISANNTTIMAMLLNHPSWKDRLWWDDMACKMMLSEDEITDHGITDIGVALGRDHALPIQNDKLLERCLLAACHQVQRDPLQEWLNKLGGWDGTPRLETWLLDVAGLTDTPYHRFCSRNLIVSMIARAYDPGCICRSVLILEGPEEYRKSTLVASLVPNPEWFDEISGSLDTKEAHMMVQGLWVAELSELDSLGRTEETRLKSFISLRVDAYIPKFKSMRVQPKRRTVFVGTTNEAVYFKGIGNTRFLPVKIAQVIDIEAFLKMRDQLYTEAQAYYHDNPTQWWRMDDDAATEATEQREQRRQASMIEDDFGDWLYRRRFTPEVRGVSEFVPAKYEVSWPEIATGYYGLLTRKDWKDSAYQREAQKVLKTLGWYPDKSTTRVTQHTSARIKLRLWCCNPLDWPEV